MTSPSPAVAVSTRDELCSLLYEAAELEHGLACSYLFAAFSLKRSEDDGLSAEQAEAVARWRKLIKGIAEQEMLHLALVCNLLTALGTAPHLGRPPFPQRSPYYPAGIVIGLHRFDEETLSRFIFLERPDDIEPEEQLGSDPDVDLGHATPPVAPGALVTAPTASDSAARGPMTVGQLYEAIDAGIGALVDTRGEGNVFIGPPPAQATAAYFRFHDLVPVTDLASARQAVDVLVSQGEGIRGDWQEAHYGQFLAIREELRTFQRSDPGFDPAWPVVHNPYVHDGVEREGTLVTDDATAPVMRLASGCYTLMTEMLLRFFAHTDESEEQLQVLAHSTVDLMEDVISPLGGLLATMPAGGAGTPAATAAFSFELHRSVDLIPHRSAAWLVFHERLVELAAFAGQLADGTSDAIAGVADALRDSAAQLEPHLARRPLSTA